MSELIRRMDYERRSKKNLSVDCGSGQKINKEYSAPVRAANEMAERKCELEIKRMEKHKKLFLGRYAYEEKVVQKFKDGLDAKSENFTEAKYQLLRAQSAAGRLQNSKQDTYIGPVVEIIPRHYYRGERKSSGVKFQIGSDVSDDETSSDEDDDDMSFKKSSDDVFKNQSPGHNASGVTPTLRWATLTKRSSSAGLRRRRESYGYIDDLRCLPARGVRLKSAPSRVMSALEPRDIKPKSPNMSRRSSRSSITESVTSINENNNHAKDIEVGGRSFRLLREAFKKKKKEEPNPKLDKLNLVKEDHFNKTCELHEKTKEKFDKLFDGSLIRY